MSKTLTKDQAQDIAEFMLAKILIDPDGDVWPEVCEIIGAANEDELLRNDLQNMASAYFRDRNVGLYNKGRAARVARILTMIDELSNALSEDRHWLRDSLTYCEDEPLDVDPMDEMSVQEILEGESSNVLITLRTMVAYAIEKAEPESGQTVIRARRRAWIRAAQIYEERLGKRAATSKNHDGKIDPSGPFVRYLLLISRPIMYNDKITPDTIDIFIDWYRGKESERDREEIADFRMLSAALVRGARG